jgi:hypothetical protein
MNNPLAKTAEMYWALVDSPKEGEDDPKPSANFQTIAACRGLRSQKLLTELSNIEIKASLLDSPDISQQVKHRIQVASQPGSLDQGRPGQAW